MRRFHSIAALAATVYGLSYKRCSSGWLSTLTSNCSFDLTAWCSPAPIQSPKPRQRFTQNQREWPRKSVQA